MSASPALAPAEARGVWIRCCPSILRAIRTGSECALTYVFGPDAEIVQDSTGVYHADLTFTARGSHHIRWVDSGALAEAQEGAVNVRESAFVTPV